jgi:hypothetical protein
VAAVGLDLPHMKKIESCNEDGRTGGNSKRKQESARRALGTTEKTKSVRRNLTREKGSGARQNQISEARTGASKNRSWKKWQAAAGTRRKNWEKNLSSSTVSEPELEQQKQKSPKASSRGLTAGNLTRDLALAATRKSQWAVRYGRKRTNLGRLSARDKDEDQKIWSGQQKNHTARTQRGSLAKGPDPREKHEKHYRSRKLKYE